MAYTNSAAANFAGGEASPRARGRYDVELFRSSLEHMRNFIAEIQGPARFRNGTRYANHTKGNNAAVLIPFEFEDQNSFVLEYTDQAIRFYKDEAPVVESIGSTITGATAANPVVLTAANSYTAGDEVYISGVAGMTELNGKYFLVSNPTGANFELQDIDGVDIDGTAFSAYTSGGTAQAIIELVSPYVEADLYELKYAQNADTMYITHKDYTPRKILRTSDVDWSIGEVSFTNTPFIGPNITPAMSDNTTPAGYTASATVNNTEAYLAFTQSNDDADDCWLALASVGKLQIQIPAGKVAVAYKITSRNSTGNPFTPKDWILEGSNDGISYTTLDSRTGQFSTDEANQTNSYSFPNSTSYTYYRLDVTDKNGTSLAIGKLEIFEAPTANDNPRACAFFEGRFWYGGTNNDPEKVWGSRGPDDQGAPRFEDFTLGTNDDDAVAFTLAPSNDRSDTIQWLAGTNKFLIVGTFGGTSRVYGSEEQIAITPSSVTVRPVDSFGCANQMPLLQGSLLFYVQQNKLILRSFEYDALADAYTSIDRNITSDHMTQTGLLQMTYSNGRPDLVWAVRGDGVLLGVSFKSKEDVTGWHRHHIGGTTSSTSFGKVLSVCTATRLDNYDQLWVVVERTINGVTRRYVEYLEDELVVPDPLDYFTGPNNKASDMETYQNALYEKQKEALHVDASLTFDGSLRGSSAGATLTPAAVTGTGITFTASASVFTSDDVGNELWGKYIQGVGGGRATITGYTSATEVECTVTVDFPSTDAIAAGNWFLTANTISGFEHLEGETIKVVTDGAAHPDAVVTSGVVSLNYEAGIVHGGLFSRGIMKSMNLEISGVNGPAQTKQKNVAKLGIRFYATLGARYGTDMYDMQNINFRSTAQKMDRPPPLFSGVKELKPKDTWSRDKHLYIEQATPAPCIVQLVDVYVETSNE